MKAAIYSPYLDTLGGGERYMLSIAYVLQKHGWDVYLESKDKDILKRIEKRLGIDTTNLRITDDTKRGEGYDLMVWLSDGSIPTLSARKNFLHFQRPFYDVDGKSLINRMKFFRINRLIVNSEFTKRWIDKEYPKTADVLYPPVDTESFKPGKKENIILYVGRFSQLEQSKKQEILLEVFKRMYDKEGSVLRKEKWRLVLAGGSDVGRTTFVEKLKKDAKTYPVTILENKPFPEILKLYASAKIFWSAAGFGVDEVKQPEKAEHFGITVVEAMAAGCVPFAYKIGGHKESIIENESGFLWQSKEALMAKTEALISSKKEMAQLAKNSQKAAEKYSLESFEKKLLSLL